MKEICLLILWLGLSTSLRCQGVTSNDTMYHLKWELKKHDNILTLKPGKYYIKNIYPSGNINEYADYNSISKSTFFFKFKNDNNFIASDNKGKFWIDTGINMRNPTTRFNIEKFNSLKLIVSDNKFEINPVALGNSNVKELALLSNSMSHCRIFDSKADVIDVQYNRTGKLEIYSTIVNRLNIFDNDDTLTSIVNCNIVNRADIHCRKLFFKKDTCKRVLLTLISSNDSVYNSYFGDCYFDGQLLFWGAFGKKYHSFNIEFNNCTFSEKSSTLFLQKDIDYFLTFNTVNLSATTINLPSPVDERKVYLTLINTDPSKIEFDYLGRYKLYFPDSINQDLVKSTYEQVLTKFKNEGKLDSYQNLDIEYKQYKNSLQIGGSVWTFIQRWWNNFGYDKQYIYAWILGVLIILTLINSIPNVWKKLINTFEIDEIHKEYEWKRPIYNPKYLLDVFIYTATVFFSFRLDLGRLSYKRKPILIWFFAQYIIGVILTAYLANYFITY